MTEQAVLRAVQGCLSLYGFVTFRRNVGGAFNGLRFVRFGESGQADLWGWERETGRHLEVEVKMPKHRTHPARAEQQRQWLARAKRDGCIAFQATSVEDCVAALEEHGYARRLLV